MNSSHNISIPQNDEIDLFELIFNLWKEKWIIILLTILATAGAVAYALLAVPSYQAKAGVLAPQVRDIVELNKGDGEYLPNVSTGEAYNRFLRALQSVELKNQFYEQVFLPSLTEEEKELTREALRRKFNTMVSIKEGEKKGYYEVSVVHDNAAIAQEWANLYINAAGQLAKAHLLQDRVAEIRHKQETLTTDIELRRSRAKDEREYEITRLEEALNIANAIGIEEPLKPEGKSTADGASYVDRNLLYMRGAKALSSQLELLKNREDDDAFIPGLPKLLSDLKFYNSITINADAISLFTFDAPAEMPETPVKPKKKLIVIIGFLLGGMLGVGVALLRIMLRNRKQQAAL